MHFDSLALKDYENLETVNGKILISSKDTWIYGRLKYQKQWEPYLIELFTKEVRPGDIVIDLGAYVGTHTVVLSKLVGESGKVFAFEPYSPSYVALLYNLQQNGCHNVAAYNCAAGLQEGTMYIPDLDTSVPQNMGAISLQTAPTSQGVPVRSLDQLFGDTLPRLRLIKIDCEMMEMEVIQGAVELIRKHRPALIVESHFDTDEAAHERLKHYLTSIGYNQILQLTYGEEPNLQYTWDFLCTHAEGIGWPTTCQPASGELSSSERTPQVPA